MTIDLPTPSFGFEISGGDRRDARRERTVQRHGVEMHRVHFGAVANLVSDIIQVLEIRRLWILIDEWSSTPIDLQPPLLDLLRRSLFPIPGHGEDRGDQQRSDFRVALPSGDHLGIEVGADAAADVDLDDFMVFGNDAECAKDFFRRLLYKHVAVVLDTEGLAAEIPLAADQFVQRAFTQQSVFEESVKASEGVPRDAINIIAMAAAKANDTAILGRSHPDRGPSVVPAGQGTGARGGRPRAPPLDRGGARAAPRTERSCSKKARIGDTR